ncbi:MAG TPA: hypothetical protein VF183_06165 [Acidimicrobiales bacterium]
MGQLAGRSHDDHSADALGGSGQGLWLESCSRCGRPITIIAATAPKDPLCEECAAGG